MRKNDSENDKNFKHTRRNESENNKTSNTRKETNQKIIKLQTHENKRLRK